MQTLYRLTYFPAAVTLFLALTCGTSLANAEDGARIANRRLSVAWDSQAGLSVMHVPTGRKFVSVGKLRAAGGEAHTAQVTDKLFGGAFGLVDAMRIGPNNGASWKDALTGPTFGTRNYFLHGRVWYNDQGRVRGRTRPARQCGHLIVNDACGSIHSDHADWTNAGFLKK